jgi:hypothetical protein
MTEDRYKTLGSILKETSLERAMIRLEKAIPYLLHLENRISEALIYHLIQKGIRLREEDKEATNELMAGVESLMNESFFGSPGSPSNWIFLVNEDGTMGAIKLANWRARRVVENIDSIVYLALHEEDRQKWKDAFLTFQNMLKV